MVQDETAEAIGEALLILRQWNKQWNPRFFMCDYSDAEINAIEQCKYNSNLLKNKKKHLCPKWLEFNFTDAMTHFKFCI